MINSQKAFSNFFNLKGSILKKSLQENTVEFYFEEHFEEIRQRFFQAFFFIIFTICCAFFNVDTIVQILEKPISNIKFFQLAPGEYFISTLEISIYFGMLISSPLFFNQLIFFLLPGLNKNERKIVSYLVISSIILFGLGLIFSYFILVPTTLGFFINYGKNSVEPLLSFNQYIGFVGVLFFGTGILFQLPIIQVLLSIFNIISGKKMLSFWKYIVICATIVSAIFTPSADPLTQILLAGVLILLYIVGSYACIVLKLN
jgi:sec-independent protein translocase protein TatC